MTCLADACLYWVCVLCVYVEAGLSGERRLRGLGKTSTGYEHTGQNNSASTRCLLGTPKKQGTESTFRTPPVRLCTYGTHYAQCAAWRDEVKWQKNSSGHVQDSAVQAL